MLWFLCNLAHEKEESLPSVSKPFGFLRQTNSFESVKSWYDDPKEAVDASRATAWFARIGAWSFAHQSGQTACYLTTRNRRWMTPVASITFSDSS